MLEQMAQRNMRAMERKDVAAIMRGWVDDGVLEVAGRSSVSGRYEGKPAIEAFFRQLFDQIETIRVTVRHVAFTNPVGFTFSNTVFVEYELEERRKNGASMHGHCVGIFEYRRGKVVAMREWWFDPTVLDAMWGPADTLATA